MARKRSRRYQKAAAKVDRSRRYPVVEGMTLIKTIATAKFDEAIDVAVSIGIDAKKTDQLVRGSVSLPKGTGKSIKIAVFADGDRAKEALAAGADYVGAADLADKIEKGWTDFDMTIASPDMMRYVGKLGKVLGPRGLMPNPKTGTVTEDTAKAVREFKAGRVEFKIDKAGNVHVPVGKASFKPQQIEENARAVIEAVAKSRPASAKGIFILSCTLSLTMSPPLRVDLREFISM